MRRINSNSSQTQTQVIIRDGQILNNGSRENINEYSFTDLLSALGVRDTASVRESFSFVNTVRRAREQFSETGLNPRLHDYYRAFHLARTITSQLTNLEVALPSAPIEIEKMKESQKESQTVMNEVQSEIAEIPPPEYPYLYLIGLATAIAAGVSLGFVIGRKITSSGETETASLQSLGSNTKELFTLFGKYAVHLKIKG